MEDLRRDFERLEHAFYDALELPEGETREAFIAHACATDPRHGEELRALLENHRALRAAAGPEPLPRFGAWQAVRKLGNGGMGDVYLTERADGAFEMSAAVKVAPLALASPHIEERFLAERRLLARLTHPSITRLLDGGVAASGLPYFVMEFIDGETIDRYAAHYSLGIRERVELLRQMLEALAYVHSQQVLHGDLKPSNVLVDTSGRVKLCDFGIAQLIAPDAASSAILALTPDYASPEQSRGEAVTLRSDIYSAGVLMRKLLAGHKAGRLLESIIRKATAEDPLLRFASATGMHAALGRYLQRPRTLRRIAGIAAALALVAVAWTAMHWRQPRAGVPSLAVLPFVNASQDPAGQPLADRLTGDVTDLLTRTKSLRVIGRPPGSRFDQSRDAREAGRRTGAAFVLDSSLDRAGELLRVSVRLIRASDGSLVWHGAWDGSLRGLSLMEGKVTASVAAHLASGARSPGAYVPNPAAEQLLRQGEAAVKLATPEAERNAEVLFRRATEIDPGYAVAYSRLAAAIWDRSGHGVRGRSEEERKELLRLARKAVELDPDAAMPHLLLAVQAMQYDWDWDEAEKEMKLAVSAGDADAGTLSNYALLLTYRGRAAEAEPWVDRALHIDPRGFAVLNNAINFYVFRGETAKQIEAAKSLFHAYPNDLSAQIQNAIADVLDRHPELAWPVFRSIRERSVNAAIVEAWTRAMAGEREEALRLIRPYEEEYPNIDVAFQGLALTYGWLNNEPEALKWLRRSADAREWQVLNVGVNPAFRNMEDTPGFHELKKRLRLE